MYRSVVAVLLIAASTVAHANAMCDTLGNLAQGVALSARDKGIPEQTIIDKVNTPKPGGLSEENRQMTVSLVKMVYARKDLNPEQIDVLAVKACELEAAKHPNQDRVIVHFK